VDGIIGSKTSTAIKAFQRDHGLYADGKINKELIEQLYLLEYSEKNSGHFGKNI
jgi:peptidoglycan hydrolase-like protein with peptidoglycan-binding domain